MSNGVPLRAAVIGLGKLGILHAGTFNSLPGCQLVAVADKSKVILNALRSQNRSIETYTDYRKMITRTKPDFVAIATPTDQHVPIAIDCAKQNIPVFIEKPLSTNSRQAKELLHTINGNPIVNMVGYMTRNLDTFRKGKEIIATGVIGNPQMLRCSMYVGQLFKKGKGWRYDPKLSGGGVLTTQNSHLIDLLLWYFGDVAWVSAHMSYLYSKSVEDHAHVVFSFENGLKGYLDASWSARHYRTPTMSIHVQGTNGTIDVDDDQVKLYAQSPHADISEGWHTWQKPDLYKGRPFDIGGTNYTDQAVQFLDAIKGNSVIESDVHSAYKVQCVIDSAYQSAKEDGAPVAVNMFR